MSEKQEVEMQGWPTEEPAGAEGKPESSPGTAGGESGEQKAFSDVPLDEDGMPTEDAMRQALKAVMDPEIGINVVDLGLVYELHKSEGRVDVKMTLTSMGCPLTELIQQQATLCIQPLPGVEEVEVEFVFSPPWDTHMISDEAKVELQAMGFAV